MTGQYTRDYWQKALDAASLNGRMFIDGKFEDASDGTTFVRIRPMDGRPGGVFARGKAADIDRAVASARAAFESGIWRRKEPAEKKRIMLRWAELMREHRDRRRQARHGIAECRRRAGGQLHPVLCRDVRQAL
jgi:gamma-glutamyl-gamma-aminobutyraldehyde dehydrogenase